MNSKKTGIICGVFYLLGVIISFTQFCDNVRISLANNPTKLFVILLANWTQIALIFFGLFTAISLFNDDFDKGLIVGLVGSLIISSLTVVRALFVVKFQFDLSIIITIMQSIVPSVMLIFMYVKTKHYSPVTLFYLPAIIYFVASIIHVATVIKSNGLLGLYPIITILGAFIGSMRCLTLGVYIKEN